MLQNKSNFSLYSEIHVMVIKRLAYSADALSQEPNRRPWYRLSGDCSI